MKMLATWTSLSKNGEPPAVGFPGRRAPAHLAEFVTQAQAGLHTARARTFPGAVGSTGIRLGSGHQMVRTSWFCRFYR